MESDFINALTFTFMSVFSMVNPIGMAPVFLAQTSRQPTEVRHRLAYKVAAYGAILLIISMFIGPAILQFFGVTLADIQVAGGIFVFFTAWGMLVANPRQGKSAVAEPEFSEDSAEDIAFFPLTMPITAGAGTIAIVLTISSKINGSWHTQLLSYLGAITGILLVFLIVAVCYRFADVIFRKLGPAGTAVLTRLTAFLLLAVGVSIVWGGITGLIATLK